MPTLAEIQSTLSANPGVTQVNSTMNCGRINSMLHLDLEEDHGITPERLVCEIQGIHGGTARHIYLRIPAGELDDVAGPVIVDGALDQFNDENLEAGVVNASLGPRDQNGIPPLVVATQGDREYGYYNGATPAATYLD